MNIHFFEISKPLDRMKLALGLGTKELGSDHYIPNQRAPPDLVLIIRTFTILLD